MDHPIDQAFDDWKSRLSDLAVDLSKRPNRLVTQKQYIESGKLLSYIYAEDMRNVRRREDLAGLLREQLSKLDQVNQPGRAGGGNATRGGSDRIVYKSVART